MPYQYKPTINALKFSPRITRSTKRLIDKICRRSDLGEADVLRFCLEAIAPEAARRGVKWLISQIPDFDHIGEETYSAMVTVRPSARIRPDLDTLFERADEAEMLRYCFLAILPVALRDGFGAIMEMREKNIRLSAAAEPVSEKKEEPTSRLALLKRLAR
jgi:hypothetical protein